MSIRRRTAIIVMSFLLGFWLILIVVPALAAETTLSWELPTETESCQVTTEPPELASTEIWQLVATLPPDATEYTVKDLAPGDYVFTASVTATDGQTSRLSGSTSKTIENVALTGSSAYILVQSDDTLILLDIGTITADTPCTPATAITDDNAKTAYKVPASSVTPYSENQQIVVAFASCGN